MLKLRKKLCPECDFLDVIKWDFQKEHQRFKSKRKADKSIVIQRCTVHIQLK